MPYNPYYPYPNYQQQNPYAPQQASGNSYAFVNGVEGAKSYYVPANQSVMLMDSDNPIAYMKTANSLGQASLKYYRLVEIDEATARGNAQQANQEYATKAELDALSKRLDELLKKGAE